MTRGFTSKTTLVWTEGKQSVRHKLLPAISIRDRDEVPMRIGQTSFIVFASRLLASALGFIATIYFARVLGATIIGYYALTIAIASWLELGGHLGISSAITKRLSEGDERSAYFTAGALSVLVLGVSSL